MKSSQRIKAIQRASMADNTRRAYLRDLLYFDAWGQASAQAGIAYPVPVEVVRAFVADHIEGLSPKIERELVKAGVKRKGKHSPGTIHRRLKALNWAHKERGLASPTRDEAVKNLMTSARRLAVRNGYEPRRSEPITKDILQKMLATVDGRTLRGIRARAVLEFGFYTGGRRRSEIAGAEMRFLRQTGRRFYYLLHHSKTDQEGRGALKVLRSPYAGGLRRWLRTTEITCGYIFRGIDRFGSLADRKMPDAEVNRIVKTYAERAGLDPALYSAHGLRRGFVTHCGRKRIPIADIMSLTDHRSAQQVIEYWDAGDLENNPATRI